MSLAQLDLECRNKIEASIKVIKDNEPIEGYYVAFSGGKDSICVLDLCRKSGVKHDAHYHPSPIDPTGIVHFIRTEYPDVIIEKPVRNFLKEFHRKGFPTRQKRWCCEYIKEWGGSGRIVLTGVRSAESRGRMKRQMIEEKPPKTRFGPPPFKVIRPIILWSDYDVWEYIEKYEINYPDLYMILDRIGCVMCPLSSPAQRQYEEKQFPKVALIWEHAFIRLYNDPLLEEKYHWSQTWKTGHDMYKWWLSI